LNLSSREAFNDPALVLLFLLQDSVLYKVDDDLVRDY
jgi:hypothetical protein